jgi:uncharacterized small protein (DUF1192 family)
VLKKMETQDALSDIQERLVPGITSAAARIIILHFVSGESVGEFWHRLKLLRAEIARFPAATKKLTHLKSLV